MSGIGVQYNNVGSTVLNQGMVFSSGGGGLLAMISGAAVETRVGNHNLPLASHIQVTALDENGKALANFRLPLDGPPIAIEVVTARRIDSIKSNAEVPIIVHNAVEIQSIHAATGNVEVRECGSVEKITTATGDVNVTAISVGDISSAVGGVRRAKPIATARGRSKSPKRTKGKTVVNNFL